MPSYSDCSCTDHFYESCYLESQAETTPSLYKDIYHYL